MAKRYVLVSASIKEANDLVKSVNELLEKGYELHGGPQVATANDTHMIYQAMTK